MTYNTINENQGESESNNPPDDQKVEHIEPMSAEDERNSRFQEYFTENVEANHPKMTDTLLRFLELKNIDEELTEIEEEKGDLPDTIESIKIKINFVEKELNEKKQSLQKLNEEDEKLKKDNGSYEEKINKYDEQKFSVRNNKEYDEIVKAIDSLFDEVEKNEARLKGIIEISGMLETDLTGLDAKVQEMKTELSEKQSSLNELDEQYKQDESGLREKRGELVIKLDPASLSLYERINKNYKGEATAIVRKGNCSGCYNSIPPQRVIEIKSAEKIFTCQSCGRILISEEIINP
ncbi:MAG: C4-type zinc ribbon domain-containing protein [Ignavibacteria bacterium]